MSRDEKVEKHQNAVATIYAAAQLLAAIDVPQLLQDIDHADAVAPILDPSLWRDKKQAMDEDRELLEASLKLRAIGIKLRQRAAATNEKAHG